MPIRVYIDGAVRTPEEAKVSVLDRGFLYGDSVYETIGSLYGRLFATRDHLDRLERSAQRIGLRVPPRPEIEKAIAETVAVTMPPDWPVDSADGAWQWGHDFMITGRPADSLGPGLRSERREQTGMGHQAHLPELRRAFLRYAQGHHHLPEMRGDL